MKNQAVANQVVAEIALQQLRRSLNITQEKLAEILQMKQATISKLESQEDMYLSTLSRYVSALGGSLKLLRNFQGRKLRFCDFM